MKCKRKCATQYCRNHAIPQRTVCYKCRNRKHRAKYPLKYCYQALKDNAKRRRKPFTITLEYFKKFCRETKYLAGKGRSKQSFTIDCKINALGYVPGNIRILPNSDNARKGAKILQYDWRTGHATVLDTFTPADPDNPF